MGEGSDMGPPRSMAELLSELGRRLRELEYDLLLCSRLFCLSPGAGARGGAEGKPLCLLADERQLLADLSNSLQMEEICRLRLRTNHLIILNGKLGEDRKPFVTVNGLTAILGWREFMVLLILAKEMRKAGQTGGDGYVSATEIADRAYEMILKKGAISEGDRQGEACSWLPTFDDVRKAIKRLRGRLPALRELIQTQQGRGYRLSTPHANITILTGASPGVT